MKTTAKKTAKTTALASTALTLPKIQPPPRKEDVINAMVERARVKHEEERVKLANNRAEAEKAAEKAIVDELKKNPQNFEMRVVGIEYGRAEVEYRLTVQPPHIEKLRLAVVRSPRLGNFDAAAMKRQIRAGMDTAGERVKALLADPSAVKALDTALAHVTAKA